MGEAVGGGIKKGGAAYAYARPYTSLFLTQTPPCTEKVLRLRLGQKLTVARGHCVYLQVFE